MPFNSWVCPELDKASMQSFLLILPRSPWLASVAWIKKEGVPVEEKTGGEGSGDKFVFVETREKAPRDFYIAKKDAEKYGFTRAGVTISQKKKVFFF